MAITISYTASDYDQILAEIKGQIPLEDPNWTDWTESSDGKVLLEGYAAIADMLRFSVDRQAAETYITDVEERQNCAKILKLISYQMANPVGLITTARFSIPAYLINSVPIPAWTRCTCSDQPTVIFATTESTVIPPGQLFVDAPLLQGIPTQVSYLSDGSASQSLLLSDLDIYEGSIQVVVGGVTWTLAPFNSLVGAEATDQIYTTRNLDDGTVTIGFGDGIEGQIPANAATVIVYYLVTQGSDVSVIKNEVNQLLDSLVDNLGNPVTVAVTNLDQPAGAADYESVQSAAYRYPLAYKALRRAVIRSDFVALANAFPGVAQSSAVDANGMSLATSEGIQDLPSSSPQVDPLSVYLYFAPATGGLQALLQDYFTDPVDAIAPCDTNVVVKQATPVTVNIVAGLYVLKNYTASQVVSAVSTLIQQWMTLTLPNTSQVFIGQNLFFQRLGTAISNIPGVYAVELALNGSNSNIIIGPDQYPSLGTLSVTLLSQI